MSSVTSASTVAMRLVQSKDDTYQRAVMSALITGSNIATELLKSTLNNFSTNVDEAFDYAKTDYTLGLPDTPRNYYKATPTDAVLQDVITAEINHPYDLDIRVTEYITYQAYHEVFDILKTDKKFAYVKWTHWYTDGSSKTLHEPMVYWYIDGTQTKKDWLFIVNSAVSTDGLSILLDYEYRPKQYDSVSKQYLETFVSASSEIIVRPSTTNTMYGDPCLFAYYYKHDIAGLVTGPYSFWFYRFKTNTHPELNGYVGIDEGRALFPIVPIRYNYQNLTGQSTETQTELYRTSKELLELLDISIDDIGVEVHKSPDIDKINDAYIMFAADIKSDDPATITYLWHYFENFPAQSSAMRFDEYGLSLGIGSDGVTNTYMPGKIGTGEIGNVRKTIWKGYLPTKFWGATISFDKQITPYAYRRITVTNPYSTTTSIFGDVVKHTLVDAAGDENNHNVIVPLEYYTALSLDLDIRNQLFADCTFLFIQAAEKKDLEWYQEPWFAVVVGVGGFILSASFASGLISGVLTAAVQGGSAVLINLAMTTAIAIVLSYAAKWVIAEYGEKIGLIGAAALLTAAVVLSYGQSGYALTSQYTLYYSQMALQCSNALVSTANEFITIGNQDIVNKYNDALEMLKDAQEAIDTNSEVQAMNLKAEFDPLSFTKPNRYYHIPNEYPDEFFNRTLNLADNSFYGIHGAVSEFATNLLTLDKNVVMSV